MFITPETTAAQLTLIAQGEVESGIDVETLRNAPIFEDEF
jgi:hypothetical protein